MREAHAHTRTKTNTNTNTNIRSLFFRNNGVLHEQPSKLLPGSVATPSGKVTPSSLDWYDQSAIDAHLDKEYDFVIMSDCTLTASDAKACFNVLNIFVGARANTVGWVGVCVERSGTKKFLELLGVEKGEGEEEREESARRRFTVEELEGGEEGFGFGKGGRYRLFKLVGKCSAPLVLGLRSEDRGAVVGTQPTTDFEFSAYSVWLQAEEDFVDSNSSWNETIAKYAASQEVSVD